MRLPSPLRLGPGLAAMVLLGGPVALAFASGAFFDGPRDTALLVVAGVLATLAVMGRSDALPRHPAGIAALAGVWSLAGWVALSRGHSPVPDVAGDDAERVVLYAGFLLAAVFALRSRTAARMAEPAVAAGVVLVIGYGLAGRWMPGVLDLAQTLSAGGRLEQPLTYWNATGMLAGLGLVLCARIAGDRARPTWLAMAAAAGAVPLLSGVYLSFSRGAAAALVAGLLVLVLCAPDRGQLRALAVVLGAGAVAVVVSGLLPGVRGLEGSLGARERDGLVALAVTLATMAAAAALVRRQRRQEADGRLRTGTFRLPRWVGPAVAAVIVAGVVVPVLAAGDERAGAGDQAEFGASTGRFASVNSNRYDYWRVALRTFGGHPLTGVGAGGWRVEWLRERPIPEAAKDAHSVELETLAELGLIGFALLALLLVGVGRSAALAQARDPVLAAGPCAALAVWAAHSALDWDWEVPAVTLPALTLAGVVVARAGNRGEAGSGRATLLARGLLLAGAVACAAVGLTARGVDRRCDAVIADAREILDASRRAEAPAVLRRALDVCADPQDALTAIAVVLQVDQQMGLTAVRALSRRDPEDWTVWLALESIEPDPARKRLARARITALNPREARP